MREIVYNSDKILLDEGTFFGQGLFETILCLDKPLFLKEHLNRLQESMKYLELETLEKKELLEFLENINIKNKVLKILVTPKNIVVTERENPYASDDYNRGMTLSISEVRRNSTSKMTKIKWNGYIENMLEKKEAIRNGYNDALFLNEKGFVTETSCANIFLIKNGVLLTPKIEDGLLGGIIREWIVSNFNVIEKSITLDELYDSDEVFITNSLMGVMKVTGINDRVFEQGDLTNMISSKLGGLIHNGR